MPSKTIQYSQQDLLEMIRRWVPEERVPRRVRVKDTADYFRVDYDDVVVLDGNPYLVRNNEREGRFGIADEQKFWVKRAIDLENGRAKILKWAFREEFHSRVGNLVFECVRSPLKESRILDIVRGRDDFMQGDTVQDAAGNPLRIMDYIRGRTLEDITVSTGKEHEDFFYNHFPSLLADFIASVRAIQFLHENGEKHGDIRRDHLIRDKATGQFRWIDFDYNYRHKASRFGYDLFGLGNVLIFIAGHGDVTTRGLMLDKPRIFDKLVEEDLNIVFNSRVANLQKVYPYIPERLNMVLMHFSAGAQVYYDNTSQLLEDLGEVLEMLEVKNSTKQSMNSRTDSGMRDKHLLISVDESEEAKHAVLYVADFVGGFPGFRATLLSIIQDPGEDFFKTGQERAEWIKKERERIRHILENYRQVLIQAGFPAEKVAIEICTNDRNDLSDTILSFQCDMSCCTVVVGRKHKSKTEEFLFGSVSSQLIHEAKNCAVWVIE